MQYSTYFTFLVTLCGHNDLVTRPTQKKIFEQQKIDIEITKFIQFLNNMNLKKVDENK